MSTQPGTPRWGRQAGLLRGIMLMAVVGCVQLTDWDDSPEAAVKTGIAAPSAMPMVVGENLALPDAYYVNAHGNELQGAAAVDWTSRDSIVARIEAGRLYAGPNPGTTYIVVRAGGFVDSTLVTVDAKFVTWPDSVRLIPGGSRLLSVRAGQVAPGSRVIVHTGWESSNSAVATVAGDGTITARTTGEVSIIARRGDYTAATHVVVASYARQLSFSDFGIGPRGICAKEADESTWCWGDQRPIDGTQADRCLDIGFPTRAHNCSASPIMMSTMPFATIVTAKTDFWFTLAEEPVGPYALSKDGRYFLLGELGPELLGDGKQFKAVWAGRPLCGAALDGLGYCWGLNFQGYMGIGTAQSIGPWPNTPTALSGGIHWTQFARGESMCGLADSGVVYCWGPNTSSEAGIGTNAVSGPGCVIACVTVATAVATTARFTQIAGGTYEVCGIATDGALYCWGRGGTEAGGPYRVPNAPSFVTLYGDSTICGVDAAGNAYCLPNTREPIPISFAFAKVGLPFPVKKLVVGEHVSCALSSASGKLFCWGSGALGAGESAAAATESNPVEVWGQRPPA